MNDDHIALVRAAYRLFWETLSKNNLEESCTNWYDYVNDPLQSDADFQYLESYFKVSQFTPLDVVRSVFSDSVAKDVKEIQQMMENETLAVIRDAVLDIGDLDFREFMEDACEQANTVNELYELCLQNDLEDEWFEFQEDISQEVRDNFERENIDLINVKIGIQNIDGKDCLVCTVNTDAPSFSKHTDKIFFEGDPFILPEAALRDFQKGLVGMDLKVGEVPEIQVSSVPIP